MRMWTRTCQSCGYKLRLGVEPRTKGATSYTEAKCRKCGSIDYDYGSWQCDKGDCDESCDELGCLNLRQAERKGD